MTLLDDITPAAEAVRSALDVDSTPPSLALVLGSGLSDILQELTEARCIEYQALPGFPAAGVSGHAGRMHVGKLHGRQVLAFQGRYHVYEGFSAWQVTAQVRLAAELGVTKLLLTNAAGGIAAELLAGDFMLVSDHLNLAGVNPLQGRREREFLDLSGLYRSDFYPQLKAEFAEQGGRLSRGVLAWMLGPSYETPAEIRMLDLLGAAAVSMSTIPEAIVARRLGLDVAALSFISNLAAGKAAGGLDHQDVLEQGCRASSDLSRLLEKLFTHW